MTPAQQTALESVAGRALTGDEVGAIDILLTAARQDVEIAAVLNAGQRRVMQSLKVEDVYEVLYFSGDYLTLKTAQLAGNPLAVMCFSILADAKQLGPGSVNMQAAQTQGLFAQLLAVGLLSQTGIDALNERALVAPPAIHYNAVSDALNVAEGRLTLGG